MSLLLFHDAVRWERAGRSRQSGIPTIMPLVEFSLESIRLYYVFPGLNNFTPNRWMSFYSVRFLSFFKLASFSSSITSLASSFSSSLASSSEEDSESWTAHRSGMMILSIKTYQIHLVPESNWDFVPLSAIGGYLFLDHWVRLEKLSCTVNYLFRLATECT